MTKNYICYFCNYSTKYSTSLKEHVINKNKCSHLLKGENIQINNIEDYYKLVNLHIKDPDNEIFLNESKIIVKQILDDVLDN